MYNHEISLISYIVGVDEIGNPTKEKVEKVRLCKIKSIGEREFYSAATTEIKPDIKFIMKKFEYEGQKELEFEGEKYKVRRAYTEEKETRYSTLAFDEIELTCEKVIGSG